MAVAFARVLRGTGLAVPTSTVIAFAEAIGTVGVTDRDGVYWAGRATLVRRPEDIAVYDRAFAVFWEHAEPSADDYVEPEPVAVTLAVDNDDDDGARVGRGQRRPDDRAALQPVRGAAAQGLRRLRRPRAGRGAPADGADAPHRFAAPLAAAGADDPADRHGPDLRRTVRAALRTEGEAVRRHFRDAGDPPPPPRPAARRQRIDGAVRPRPAALRPGRRRRPPARRGVRPRHPADAHHARARVARSRPRPHAGRPIASSTGPVAPGSATGCAGSTTSGACAAWHVAPTW